MLMISEYGNCIKEVKSQSEAERLERAGFREYKPLDSTQKIGNSPKSKKRKGAKKNGK